MSLGWHKHLKNLKKTWSFAYISGWDYVMTGRETLQKLRTSPRLNSVYVTGWGANNFNKRFQNFAAEGVPRLHGMKLVQNLPTLPRKSHHLDAGVTFSTVDGHQSNVQHSPSQGQRGPFPAFMHMIYRNLIEMLIFLPCVCALKMSASRSRNSNRRPRKCAYQSRSARTGQTTVDSFRGS